MSAMSEAVSREASDSQADSRARQLAGLKSFKPGVSGNPSGKNKHSVDIPSRDQVLTKLWRLARDPNGCDTPMAVIAACKILLDYIPSGAAVSDAEAEAAEAELLEYGGGH